MCVHHYNCSKGPSLSPTILFGNPEVFHGHPQLDFQRIQELTLEQLNVVKRQILIDINTFNIEAVQVSNFPTKVAANALADDQILLDMVNMKIKQIMKAKLK